MEDYVTDGKLTDMQNFKEEDVLMVFILILFYLVRRQKAVLKMQGRRQEILKTKQVDVVESMAMMTEAVLDTEPKADKIKEVEVELVVQDTSAEMDKAESNLDQGVVGPKSFFFKKSSHRAVLSV